MYKLIEESIYNAAQASLLLARLNIISFSISPSNKYIIGKAMTSHEYFIREALSDESMKGLSRLLPCEGLVNEGKKKDLEYSR